MRSLARSLPLFLLLFGVAAGAETVFEVIELRYRSPDELLPVLRPLVEPEGTIGSAQNKLVVRAPREQMRELRRLIAELDSQPQQLLITVRQGGTRDSRTRARGVSGKGKFGDVTVDVPPNVDPSLPGVGVAGSKGGVEVRGGARESHSDESGDQQLMVLEGREAVIYVGQEVPYPVTTVTPGGVVSETTEFRQVMTGFLVRPRVQGDQVTLDVSPQRESLEPGKSGAVNVSRLSTSVSGRLGEWIDLGAVTQQGSFGHRDRFSRSETSTETRGEVQIKVEAAPR